MKSHVGTKDLVRRYQCLLCALVGENARTYDGESHLFEHVARHEGFLYGDTRISGPIEIAYDRVSACSMIDFDIYIPLAQRPPGPMFMLPESIIGTDQAHPDPVGPEQSNVLSSILQSDESQVAELEA